MTDEIKPRVEGTIAVPDVPDQVRVRNIVNMFLAGDYGDPNAKQMRVFPLMCKAYHLLEQDANALLNELRNRSWMSLAEAWPKLEDEVLLRFDDASGTHVEHTIWTEEEDDFFQDEEPDRELVYWMKLPPL